VFGAHYSETWVAAEASRLKKNRKFSDKKMNLKRKE